MHRVAMSVVAAAWMAGAVLGDEIAWDSSIGGVLTNGSFWDGGMAPGDADGGRFDSAGMYTLTLTSNAEFGYIAVDGSSPVFDLGAHTLSMAFFGDMPPGVSVGRSMGTTSELTLSSGTIVCDTASIALVDGASAAAVVSGATALWEVPFRLDVGLGGDGVLEILSGATVDCGQVLVGRQSTASGRVTIDGAGSLLEGSFLTIGEEGDGTLEVLDGGKATLVGLQVGIGSGSAGATVMGMGSEIDATVGDAVIGDGGEGTLHFEDGTLRARDIVFARFSGEATADALSGGFFASRDVIVGASGVADVAFGQGHTTLCDRLRVASGNSSLATLDLDGVVIAQTRVDVSPGLFSIGTLNLGASGGIAAPDVRVFSNGVLRGGGVVNGDLNVSGGVAPAGTLSVGGDVTFAGIVGAGALLHTADATENTLDVSGSVTLAGTFRVDVAEGFAPATDQQFVALRAGSISGGFSTIVTPDEDWSVSVVGNEVIATYTGSASPADLTGDGVVDSFDLAALLALWGPCAGCDADFNGDGVVEAFDLSVVLAAWD